MQKFLTLGSLFGKNRGFFHFLCRKRRFCLAEKKLSSTFAAENETSDRGVEQLVARQAHNLEVVRSS
ncbi:MAG: hypothetical protein J1F06_07475, partial [Prevotellaceae bacterium]|nr:hypothetical protein [Prevotellaceae bacterium]